jgi:uncharacterized protein
VDFRNVDLKLIEPAECLELLASVPVSRVGFVTEHGPDVLPVNHLVHDGRVVFRAAAGTKLGVAAVGARVAVEADEYDADDHPGWSVVVHGDLTIVTGPERRDALHTLDFSPWSAPDRRDFWLEVTIDHVSGRRIVR